MRLSSRDCSTPQEQHILVLEIFLYNFVRSFVGARYEQVKNNSLSYSQISLLIMAEMDVSQFGYGGG